MTILKRSEMPAAVNDAADDLNPYAYVSVHRADDGTIEVVLDGRFDVLALRRLTDELVQMIGD